MDPLTALSVACNVIDLVSTAISCGLAVRDIYKSVDGRTRANAALEKEVDGMKAVVLLLREKNSKIKVFTDDEDIQKKVSELSRGSAVPQCAFPRLSYPRTLLTLYRTTHFSKELHSLKLRVL
jgi:hypothetical protein